MKILFYSDTSGFGGHEIMTMQIMKGLLELDTDVSFVCEEQNRRLLEECAKMEEMKVIPLPIHLNRFSYLSNFIDWKRQGVVRKVIHELKPECLVAVQGTIEVSSLGILAAKKERVTVLSYLAFTQSAKTLGLPNAPARDIVDRQYYSIPDRFITISESQKNNLVARGVEKSRIGVVENITRFDPSVRPDKVEARKSLGLEADTKYIGIVGRVVLRHKGHHYLVQAVEKHREAFEGIDILVVGDGEDLEELKRKIAERNVEGKIRFLPWSDKMHTIYSALDAVILPSNHEGVPLVMIEAVLHGLPVLASRIDGMRDYLPPEWLFTKGNIGEMASIIAIFRDSDPSVLARQVRQVRERFESVFLREDIGREFLAEIRLAIPS